MSNPTLDAGTSADAAEPSTQARSLEPAKRKKKYKSSLNLPKTPFPMKASLAQNEPRTRKRWEREGLFRKILDARTGALPFPFHDGPPFANGSIHVGHLLNKILKDLVVRTRTAMGQRCHYVPGWDCHGLPIEHKVVSEMVETGKMAKLEQLDLNVRRMVIRRECQKYASKFKKIQAEQMKRLLTLADYDEPYLTMSPGYEKSVLEVFAGLVEQGLVYRDLKPVHWSIANRTALAEAELEYRDREDPSIYVGFEVLDPASLARTFGIEPEAVASPPRLMIWTTTPWTLPANLLIAVHEEMSYSLVRLGDQLTVLASELVATVAGLEGHQPEELGRVRGAALVGHEYQHPFCDRQGRIVAADYVTYEDGTGLVHTAPGHGQEDYDTGMREGLEVYCPVRGDGTYDDTVPEWLRGKSIWQANELLIERLRESGHLYHDLRFVHSYPHDWRSKTPVIFRCTEQWFISVDRPTRRDGKSLREMAFEQISDSVRFIPAWGENRMRDMVEARPDWCISRQRSWGLPIPAFRTPTGELLLTVATVRAVAEAFGRWGSDAWFEKSPAELLADWDPASDSEAPAGVGVNELEKMYDIFDVWLESGSSWNAVMRARGLGYPVKLYLEGSDQHRGWFQLSMLPALGVTGQAPFEAVLTHGFTVDKDGKKMSKSLGNVLGVDDLLAQHGADVLRWWVSSLAFENDIKVDPSFFELAGDSYRKVRNTLRFLLSNLRDFDPAEHGVDLGELPPTSLDAWALDRLGDLRRRVLAAYESFHFRQAHLLLFDFCNDTLSSVYLDAVKDRLYCDRCDSPRLRASQTAMHRIADTLIVLLAPILAHTAEEAHDALHGEGVESVHLRTFPEPPEIRLDDAWGKVHEARHLTRKALEAAKAGEESLENPLDAGVRLVDASGELARFQDDLPDILGVSQVELLPADGSETSVEVVDLRALPRCERSWRRDSTVKLRSDGGMLSDRDAEAVGLT
ncbi:MAG: isoleucine--tRNA ligase [Holophagales bacterium]|nr:isoleucine--tRNA ligase [Holophagales bacterium]